MTGGAVFSDCQNYRYRLWREICPFGANQALFIMLNPSTADAEMDDPTIRRCVNFARDWDCALMWVVNLFALRSTDPNALKKATDPVGPENRRHIQNLASTVRDSHQLNNGGEGFVVCAWGTQGTLLDQDKAVLGWLDELGVQPTCLRTTKDGHPSHPLYLPKDLKPIPFTSPIGGQEI